MNKPHNFDNIDWFITRLCNQRKKCKFCFAPWDRFPIDATYEQAKLICQRLAEIGIKIVTICGGEPTLYPHIFETIQLLYQLGLKVNFYSNLATQKNVEVVMSILPFIDILSVPVDAVTQTAISQMRGRDQFKSVCKTLDDLQSIETKPTIKIGTVVTKQNINDLKNLFLFLENYQIINIWRIYQFSPYGQGKKYEDLFLVSDDDFNRAVSAVKKMAPNKPINISVRKRSNNIGYCHIMDSQGGLYRYEEEYIDLGVNVFNKPEEIIVHYDEKTNRLQKRWQRKIF